jgi:glutathione S-transferase
MIELFDLATESDLRPSPYCWRAKLALKHKALAFETRAKSYSDIRLLGDGTFKTLPVIRDDDRWVGGSMNIADYLESRHADASTLFPHDPGRLFVNFIEAWIDSTIQPLIFPIIACDIWKLMPASERDYFRRTREMRLGTSLENAQELNLPKLPAVRASLEPVRRTLKRQPFLCGDAPAYADYTVYGALKWQRLVSEVVLFDEQDPIHAWYLHIDRMATQ